MWHEIFARIKQNHESDSKQIHEANTYIEILIYSPLNTIRLIKTEMEIQINPTSNNERKDFLRGREGKPPRDNLQR